VDARSSRVEEPRLTPEEYEAAVRIVGRLIGARIVLGRPPRYLTFIFLDNQREW
jgi:hypothetical protein